MNFFNRPRSLGPLGPLGALEEFEEVEVEEVGRCCPKPPAACAQMTPPLPQGRPSGSAAMGARSLHKALPDGVASTAASLSPAGLAILLFAKPVPKQPGTLILSFPPRASVGAQLRPRQSRARIFVDYGDMQVEFSAFRMRCKPDGKSSESALVA